MSFAFRHLVLERPMAVVDLETTGVDPRNDRIIEVGVLGFAPDADPIRYRRLVHPGVPIPPAASAIHGIADHVVAEKPRFQAIYPRLARLLADADLAGFNIRRFDLPFLAAEFARAGIEFAPGHRAVLDAQKIYHEREPRDLRATMRFCCGREYGEAHGTLADAEATPMILDAQVARYPDLPTSVTALQELLTDVDIGERFRPEVGRVVFAFGKHLGRPLYEVARRDPGYPSARTSSRVPRPWWSGPWHGRIQPHRSPAGGRGRSEPSISTVSFSRPLQSRDRRETGGAPGR